MTFLTTPSPIRVLPDHSTLVAAAPGTGPHHWAGAPAATATDDGGVALAYRVRHGFDGGDRVVVATSEDGVRFETLAEITSASLGARWTERPSLVRTPQGRWRLYVCGADPAGPNWWVAALEAPTLEGLPQADLVPVFPGGGRVAVKDPVIRQRDGRWEAWLCCHLLDQPGEEDRMQAELATSDDGWTWRQHGVVLSGRTGQWDARGVRITGLLPDGSVFYDGRASRAENWFERSGRAVPTGRGRHLVADPSTPVTDVRYVEVLPMPGGATRLYYEVRKPDDSHELRTQLVQPTGGRS